MNYLDIREEQGPSYFIIRLYLNKEKKLSKFPFLWISITILK